VGDILAPAIVGEQTTHSQRTAGHQSRKRRPTTGIPLKEKNDMSFVTVTYSREYPLLRLQALSMAYFFDAADDNRFKDIIVVLSDLCHRDSCVREFNETILPYYGHLQSRVKVYNARELVANESHVGYEHSSWRQDYVKLDGIMYPRGWRVQQVLKLTVASVVRSKYYVILDSKNHFLRSTTTGLFVDEVTGKGLMPFNESGGLRADDLQPLQPPHFHIEGEGRAPEIQRAFKLSVEYLYQANMSATVGSRNAGREPVGLPHLTTFLDRGMFDRIHKNLNWPITPFVMVTTLVQELKQIVRSSQPNTSLKHKKSNFADVYLELVGKGIWEFYLYLTFAQAWHGLAVVYKQQEPKYWWAPSVWSASTLPKDINQFVLQSDRAKIFAVHKTVSGALSATTQRILLDMYHELGKPFSDQSKLLLDCFPIAKPGSD
jgi:hypothetical protein